GSGHRATCAGPPVPRRTAPADVPPAPTGPQGGRAAQSASGPPPSQPQVEHVLAQVLVGQGPLDLGVVCLLAPQFELVAHAQQYRLLLDADRRAVAGGNGNAAIAVQLHRGGGADQLQLQLAVRGTGAGQLVDLVAHPLPLLVRVQVERAGLERVVGDHQAVAALARDQVTVGRGNGHPSLVVHCDSGLALEHFATRIGCWGYPRKTTKLPVFPLAPTLAPPTGLSTGCGARNRLSRQWLAKMFTDKFKGFPQVAV